ncbi:MAG: hypothetical protein ACT4PV_09400 [Planctomycetaceae bacterium]
MPRNRLLFPILLLALAFAPARAEEYEAPAVLKASTILPPELLKSAFHTVREEVRTDGLLHQFQVESKFGLFECDGMRMLRIRVHEIGVLGTVFDKEKDNEFFKGLGGRLVQTLTLPVKLVTDPIGTVKSVGRGVGKTIKKIGGLFRKREKSDQEDTGVRALLVSQEKRKLAAELGLDVYSTNPKVQEFLNAVADRRAAGTLVWDVGMIFVPGGAGVAIGAASSSANMMEVLRDNSPTELFVMNEKKLKKMGVEAEVIKAFLNQASLSPRHQTVIVAALEAMEGVGGRATLLTAALDAEKESEALFHESRAQHLARWHKEIDPLASLEAVHELPVSTTMEGRRLVLLPVDSFPWAEETAAIVEGLAEGGGKWTLAVTGKLTERARKEATGRGYVIREALE